MFVEVPVRISKLVNYSCVVVAVTVLTLASPGKSVAISSDIFSAITPRSDVALDGSEDYSGASFDIAPASDALGPFNGFLSLETYTVGSFLGGDNGYVHELFFLSEVTCFDGNSDCFGDSGIVAANEIGFINGEGDFDVAIEADEDPGVTKIITQEAGEELTLALNSPEGLFSSVDEDNPDGGSSHIRAKIAEEAGSIAIDHANYAGTVATSFDLEVGDIVLFMEDLLALNNTIFAGTIGDFDYQDSIVVMRSSEIPKEIPEPASMLLLSAALGGGVIARRRKAE